MIVFFHNDLITSYFSKDMINNHKYSVLNIIFLFKNFIFYTSAQVK